MRVKRENLQGYQLADGVMFLMHRGDKYHDLQPVWDYRKLPGLTIAAEARSGLGQSVGFTLVRR